MEIYHSDIKKIKEQRIRELAPVLNNSARRILESLGAGAERVRGEKEKLARYDLASLAEEALGLSPLVSNVLQRAMRLALQLGQQSPDSRHLLLAFVAREDSYEARILAQLGLDLGQARRRACEALGVDPEKAQRVLEGSEALGEKEGLLRKILRKFTRPDDP